eukprot:CAMPEP_0175073990 /NCGR_PEP_ID=MMETSP0052_2-20121109/20970_1 /TAXON_ID=51329 ORGANISM="Polytomella parva, Strain SAG 63-3" /NCGR_SAMPLE_ID=MMETSP0052_2 /ASSEMBLY_ACC=CAM_ASM_000194 /LENGTH=233 /DNA_ID=CAMNT_0016342063 /DNA_START=23 /DNA_END=721 /DNA_ORIENTATION=+
MALDDLPPGLANAALFRERVLRKLTDVDEVLLSSATHIPALGHPIPSRPRPFSSSLKLAVRTFNAALEQAQRALTAAVNDVGGDMPPYHYVLHVLPRALDAVKRIPIPVMEDGPETGGEEGNGVEREGEGRRKKEFQENFPAWAEEEEEGNIGSESRNYSDQNSLRRRDYSCQSPTKRSMSTKELMLRLLGHMDAYDVKLVQQDVNGDVTAQVMELEDGEGVYDADDEGAGAG